MKNLFFTDLPPVFADNGACLEFLKDQRYPNGIECPICKRVTKHSKLLKRHCYECNSCGNQIYPTAGTIFNKSTTPLKTWFEIIRRMFESDCRLSAKDVQREYGVTYKTAWRLLHRIKGALAEKRFKTTLNINNDELKSTDDKYIVRNTILDNSKFEIPERLSEIITDQEAKKSKFHQKGDRTARLLKLQMLLSQYPQGLHVSEIASKCSISKRTVYRDLRALESELNIPIWEERGKRGASKGHFLPPISFTLNDAINIFLSLRVMQSYISVYIPNIAATFVKLNTIVPMPLKKQISDTLDFMEKLPLLDKRRIDNSNKLFHAWLFRQKVRIRYQHLDEGEPIERIIEPYYIEPSLSAVGGSNYVIAYCNVKKEICAFIMARIVGVVIIEPDSFEIPANFNAVDFIGAAWGGHFNDQKIETVKICFKPKASGLVQEIHLHPSQSIEMQEDGSAIMKLKIRDNIHFRSWILGWGDQVELLAPQRLRDQINDLGKSLVSTYSHKKPFSA
jgi:predicted DNA-binding transcriptional regulator YafY